MSIRGLFSLCFCRSDNYFLGKDKKPEAKLRLGIQGEKINDRLLHADYVLGGLKVVGVCHLANTQSVHCTLHRVIVLAFAASGFD